MCYSVLLCVCVWVLESIYSFQRSTVKDSQRTNQNLYLYTHIHDEFEDSHSNAMDHRIVNTTRLYMQQVSTPSEGFSDSEDQVKGRPFDYPFPLQYEA